LFSFVKNQYLYAVLKNTIRLKDNFEIWEKFKAGDKSALSYVYFQYFHSMYQYGIKFKDDPEFIKDCIQDVFFKLIKAGENLGTTDNIRYYLFKALKNTIYENAEKYRKIGGIEIVTLKFDATFSLEEEILEKENATQKEQSLAKALYSLSGRQREIIYLRYECGMEYGQICDIMQLQNDSARKLVYRAIKLLKETIKGQQSPAILFLLRFSQKNVF